MEMAMSNCTEVTWFSLLFLTCMFRGLEASIRDACAEDGTHVLSSSQDQKVSLNIDKEKIACLIYPTHELNCSWSFPSLEKEAQISVTISVCDDDDKTVQTLESKEPVGSRITQIDKSAVGVVLHVNISLHNHWVFYQTYENTDRLDILPPPPNVKASFKGSDLLITWDSPSCRTHCRDHCFEYEVQLRDQQEKPKHVEKDLSYTEKNADLTQSYTVRIRTRTFFCPGSQYWSNWSQPVSLPAKQAAHQLTAGEIIAISLGIPMILLALLLLVCQRSRVFKRLFPPVPSPPQKYLHVLQNTDVFVSPDLTENPEEEVTFVFYSEN